VRRLYDWVLRWAATPYAPCALALLAVTEAFFFPVPTETLLVPMALARRKKSLHYAALAVVCSVLGGAIGYGLGRWVGDPLLRCVAGLPVLSWMNLMDKYEATKVAFGERSSLYIFIAALTPAPYMLCTNAAGVCHTYVPFPLFVAASVVGRGLRFGLIGLLFRLFGPPIKRFIDRYFNLLTILLVVLLVLGAICAKLLFDGSDKGEGDRGMLSESARTTLLNVARQTVEAAVRKQPLPQFQVDDAELQAHQGAFVTLRTGGNLRGCIGRFVADMPLWQVVREMAVAAATQDPRFFGMQIRPEELPQVQIEISVLSPLRLIQDPIQEIELGKHGIYITRGGRSGCFLPQVATETGWGKEEFLAQCCAGKAGLASDAWKDPETKVYVFTAEILEEGQG